MEVLRRLSNVSEQRVYYFKNGCDKDGLQIENLEHLLFAYGHIELSVQKDLGEGAKQYMADNIDPVFKTNLEGLSNREI